MGTTRGSIRQPVDESTAYALGSIGIGLGMLLVDSGLDPDTPLS